MLCQEKRAVALVMKELMVIDSLKEYQSFTMDDWYELQLVLHVTETTIIDWREMRILAKVVDQGDMLTFQYDHELYMFRGMQFMIRKGGDKNEIIKWHFSDDTIVWVPDMPEVFTFVENIKDPPPHNWDDPTLIWCNGHGYVLKIFVIK